MANLIARFAGWSERLSRLVERRVFGGTFEYDRDWRPVRDTFLVPGAVIADVGGGKRPWLTEKKVADHGFHYVGMDIDAGELSLAPPGTYHETRVVDIERVPEDLVGTFDGVVSICCLEHVGSAERAIGGVLALMKPGGSAIVALPCRKAIFARLNLLLPQAFKRRALHTIFPHKVEHGFPAHYDRATPGEYVEMIEASGGHVKVIGRRYTSSYAMVFFPAYLVWRMVALGQRALDRDYCESFWIHFTKPE